MDGCHYATHNAKVTLFIVLAHFSNMVLPVGMNAVNDTFCIPGWLTIQGPRLSLLSSTYSIPGEKIDCPTLTAFEVVYGVYDLDFK